jgi:hypothetical protein
MPCFSSVGLALFITAAPSTVKPEEVMTSHSVMIAAAITNAVASLPENRGCKLSRRTAV